MIFPTKTCHVVPKKNGNHLVQTLLKHPFGNGLYRLFMVIWMMVYYYFNYIVLSNPLYFAAHGSLFLVICSRSNHEISLSWWSQPTPFEESSWVWHRRLSWHTYEVLQKRHVKSLVSLCDIVCESLFSHLVMLGMSHCLI